MAAQEDLAVAQSVEPSEEGADQKLVEVGSVEENLQSSLEKVDDHESIIIPAIQPKDEQKNIPEIDENWEQVVLVTCEHCGRTFLPDRLEVHQRSCKSDKPLKRRNTEQNGVKSAVKPSQVMPSRRQGVQMLEEQKQNHHVAQASPNSKNAKRSQK